MHKYEEKILEVLQEQISDIEVKFSTPPDPKMGDIAFPAFDLAKKFQKKPFEMASDLKRQILEGEYDFIERIEVQGGFLNFFINKSNLIKDVIQDVKSKKGTYGSSGSGIGKTALVEHTSINPNASPHVGRARNALIGDVIVRLLRFEGYSVETHYFVNDVGKQIAMLVLGARKSEAEVNFKNLLDIYVNINREVEANSVLENYIFEILNKLENQDEETVKEFKKIVDICIEGQTNILKELDIKYDYFDAESIYIWGNRTNEILEDFDQTGKLIEDESGRLLVNLEGYNLPLKSPVLVLTRSDKTSLYPLRDVAYTIDKVKKGADKNIIVLGEDQKAYFQQIKACLDILGYTAPQSVHYSFVLLSDGKMSTRKGTVVLFEDFMSQAVSKVKEEMEKRHENVDMDVVKAIAYGAVKYEILKVANEKNVTFDWDTALSFEGDSCPYLQYSYVRINSIFRKFDKELSTNINTNVLVKDEEYELAKELAIFPSVVKKTLEELSPHLIATYIYNLTRKFSTFYHNCSIVNAESKELQDARLVLIDCVRQVIKNGLNLLGINVIDYM